MTRYKLIDKQSETLSFYGIWLVRTTRKTSSAGSATLGDTIWDKLTSELTSRSLPDSQLCLKGTIWVENEHLLGGGDTEHTLLRGETLGEGTPHIIERKITRRTTGARGCES